jgi:hypothetical protein
MEMKNFNLSRPMKTTTTFLLLIAIVNLVSWQSSLSQEKVKIGFWTQFWYQYVENGKNGEGLNDFMIRRAYFFPRRRARGYFLCQQSGPR